MTSEAFEDRIEIEAQVDLLVFSVFGVIVLCKFRFIDSL